MGRLVGGGLDQLEIWVASALVEVEIEVEIELGKKDSENVN